MLPETQQPVDEVYQTLMKRYRGWSVTKADRLVIKNFQPPADEPPHELDLTKWLAILSSSQPPRVEVPLPEVVSQKDIAMLSEQHLLPLQADRSLLAKAEQYKPQPQGKARLISELPSAVALAEAKRDHLLIFTIDWGMNQLLAYWLHQALNFGEEGEAQLRSVKELLVQLIMTSELYARGAAPRYPFEYHFHTNKDHGVDMINQSTFTNANLQSELSVNDKKGTRHFVRSKLSLLRTKPDRQNIA